MDNGCSDGAHTLRDPVVRGLTNRVQRALTLPPGLIFVYIFCLFERTALLTLKYALILLLVERFGSSDARAALVVGAFGSVMYVLYCVAGYLVDRVFGVLGGLKRGCALVFCGYTLLAINLDLAGSRPDFTSFAVILAILTAGTGLSRISTFNLVGLAYAPEDPRRTVGFSIYYWTESVGALLAAIFAGFLIPNFGWIGGFGIIVLGIGASFALFFLRGDVIRALITSTRDPDVAVVELRNSMPIQIACIVAMVGLPLLLIEMPQFGLFPLIAAVVLAALYLRRHAATLSIGRTRDDLIVIVGVTLMAIAFPMLQEQQWSSMILFTDRMVQMSVLGLSFHPLAFQMINPIALVLFAPLAATFITMRDQSARPLSAFAQGRIAFLLLGACFMLLLAGCLDAPDGERVGMFWLVAALVAAATAELFFVPIAFATVTRIAPPAMLGTLSGIWFLSFAIGDYLSGLVASLAQTDVLAGAGAVAIKTAYSGFFLKLVFGCGGIAVLATIANRWSARRTGRVRREPA